MCGQMPLGNVLLYRDGAREADVSEWHLTLI